MKKTVLLIIGLYILFAFKTDTENICVVSQPLSGWQSDMNTLEAAKNMIRQSDIPSKYSFPIIDSISKIQMKFRNQILPQLPKPLKDSSNKIK